MGSVRRKPSSASVREKDPVISQANPGLLQSPNPLSSDTRGVGSPTTSVPMFPNASGNATVVASSGASAVRFPRVNTSSTQYSHHHHQQQQLLPHDQTAVGTSPSDSAEEAMSGRYLQVYEEGESTVSRAHSCLRTPPSAADILSDTNPFRVAVPASNPSVETRDQSPQPPSVPAHNAHSGLTSTPFAINRTFSPNPPRHQQITTATAAAAAAVRRPTAPTPPPLATPLGNHTVPNRNCYLYHSLRLPSSTSTCEARNGFKDDVLLSNRHGSNRETKRLSPVLPDVYTPVPFVRNLPERSTIQHVPSGLARQRLEETVSGTGRLVRHGGRQSIATHSIRLRTNPLLEATAAKGDSSNAVNRKEGLYSTADFVCEDIDDADLVVVTPRAVTPIDADAISLSSGSTTSSASMSTLAQQHNSVAIPAGRFRKREISPDRLAPTAGRQHRSLTKTRGTVVGRACSPPSQSQLMHRHYSMRPTAGSTVNSTESKSPGPVHGERGGVAGGVGINHFFRTLTTRISRRLFRRSTIIQPSIGNSGNSDYSPGPELSSMVAPTRHDPKMAPTFDLDKVVALSTSAREASPSSGHTGGGGGGGHIPRSRSGVASSCHHQRANVSLAAPTARRTPNDSRLQTGFTEDTRTLGLRRSSQRSFRVPCGTGSSAMNTLEGRDHHLSRVSTIGTDDDTNNNTRKSPMSDEPVQGYSGGSSGVGGHQSMRYFLRPSSTQTSLQEVLMDVQQSLSRHGVDFEQIGDMKLHCVYGDPSQGCRVPTLAINNPKTGKQVLSGSGDAQNPNNDGGIVHWEMEIGKLTGASVNGIRFKRINGSMPTLRQIVNKIAADMKL